MMAKFTTHIPKFCQRDRGEDLASLQLEKHGLTRSVKFQINAFIVVDRQDSRTHPKSLEVMDR
jgi:hypothetical protein